VTAREVFFLIGPGGSVVYRDEGESASFIPDSRARWEAIWSARESLVEIAHSHPVGPLAFSAEDEGTMEAVTAALGRSVLFSVVTGDHMVRREVAPSTSPRAASDVRVSQADEPGWVAELRRASGLERGPPPGEVAADASATAPPLRKT